MADQKTYMEDLIERSKQQYLRDRNRYRSPEDQNSGGQALGSFKKGGKVPKTGLYKLHKGEKVVPAKKRKK